MRHLILFLILLLFAGVGAADDTSPFKLNSRVYYVSLTTSASTPVRVLPVYDTNDCRNYQLSNTGANSAWVELAPTSAAAVPDIPGSGDPGTSVLVFAGTTIVVGGPSKAYISAKTASSTTTLYISCGEGTVSGTTLSGSSGTAAADQGTAGTTAGAWPVKVTDGTDIVDVTAAGEAEVIESSAAAIKTSVELTDDTVAAPGSAPTKLQGVQCAGSNSGVLTASAQIKASAGHLCGVFVAQSTSCTIKLWQNTAASGTVLIDTFTVPAVGWHSIPLPFSTGLYATLGGTCSVTFGYN